MGFCLTRVSARQPLVALTVLPSLSGESGHFPRALLGVMGLHRAPWTGLHVPRGCRGAASAVFERCPGGPRKDGQLFCRKYGAAAIPSARIAASQRPRVRSGAPFLSFEHTHPSLCSESWETLWTML